MRHRTLHLLGVWLLLAALVGVVAPPSARATPVDEAAPASIRVCRSSGSVDTVPFKTYVKVVLPVEFPAHWPVEALRAGAVAIKSYAWYYVRHPISERCDIGDTTRHQLYDPSKRRRTATSDRAVEETWGLRLDDTKRGEIAFAQYCSRGCPSHYAYAGEGRFIEQERLRDLAKQGWKHPDLLRHFYRNLPVRLSDWTAPFALASGEDVVSMTSPPAQLVVGVAGVGPGDPRASVHALANCTINGRAGSHLLQHVPVSERDGRAVAVLDQLGALGSCAEDEASLSLQLVVNAHVTKRHTLPAWRQWVSDADRKVVRVAETSDPVLAAVQVSRSVFDSRQPEADGSSELDVLMGILEGDAEEEELRLAEFAVLARSDTFPDALGATALAGTSGPILLTPGGADRDLAPEVAAELERTLAPGAEVRIIGGTGGVSSRAEEQVRELGLTPRRIGGGDRVSTALALADVVVGGGKAPRVLVVRGFPDGTAGWADAIAIGPWAARTGTPILITPDREFAHAVEAWIEDPDHGVEEVIVIGGTGAVPASVERRLDGVTVTRVRGVRRDATALAVADQLWGSRGTPAARHVFVADAYGPGGWAFAVAASVPAAIGDAAALTVADLVPPSTSGQWLDARPGVGATIVGDRGVVTRTVEDSLAGRETSGE